MKTELDYELFLAIKSLVKFLSDLGGFLFFFVIIGAAIHSLVGGICRGARASGGTEPLHNQLETDAIKSVERKDLQWFTDRIGKTIYRDDNETLIRDEDHAKWLYTYQIDLDLIYRDIK